MKMTTLAMIAILTFASIMQGSSAKNCESWLSDLNGGSFTSPRFPFYYPSNSRCTYHLQPPQDHVVVITFTTFILVGLDSVRIVDGSKFSNQKSVRYTGWRKSFNFVSETNEVKVLFATDGWRNNRGFRATYKFIDTKLNCPVASLKQNVTNVTSCINETNGYASQCQLSCQNSDYKPTNNGTTTCVNGSFTRVRCQPSRFLDFINKTANCPIASLTQNDTNVTSCNDETNGYAPQCKLSCGNSNYKPSNNGTTTCVNGSFTPIQCQPIAELVKQCEDSNMENCSYTVEEMVEYYRNNDVREISSGSHKKEDEILNGIPVQVGRGPRRYCYPVYCSQGNNVLCGNFKRKFFRICCFACRYVTSCRNELPQRILRAFA